VFRELLLYFLLLKNWEKKRVAAVKLKGRVSAELAGREWFESLGLLFCCRSRGKRQRGSCYKTRKIEREKHCRILEKKGGRVAANRKRKKKEVHGRRELHHPF
jgi:hypothetical protein